MTLEEYRRQAVQRIRACNDPAAARVVLAEVDLVLLNARVSERTLNEFWEQLNADLQLVAEEGTRLLGSEAAGRVTRVIEAARLAIAQYQLMETDDPASLE